jgi:hypothetical protein
MHLDRPRACAPWQLLAMLALIVVGLLTVLGATSGPVAAQEASSLQVAQDGQRPDEQPLDVRATFSAVRGDQAPARWIRERNAALAGGQTPTGRASPSCIKARRPHPPRGRRWPPSSAACARRATPRARTC